MLQVTPERPSTNGPLHKDLYNVALMARCNFLNSNYVCRRTLGTGSEVGSIEEDARSWSISRAYLGKYLSIRT